jgi:hypothetical protein
MEATARIVAPSTYGRVSCRRSQRRASCSFSVCHVEARSRSAVCLNLSTRTPPARGASPSALP